MVHIAPQCIWGGAKHIHSKNDHGQQHNHFRWLEEQMRGLYIAIGVFMITLPLALLRKTVKNRLPKDPIWSILTINEYLSRGDPLRKILVDKARKYLETNSAISPTLLEKVFVDGLAAYSLREDEMKILRAFKIVRKHPLTKPAISESSMTKRLQNRKRIRRFSQKVPRTVGHLSNFQHLALAVQNAV